MNLRTAPMGVADLCRLSAPAQRAIARQAELAPHLASNGYTELEEDVWYSLYSVKPAVKADVALELVSRRLTRGQIQFVLRNEKRSTVLTSLLRHHLLEREEIELGLLSKNVSVIADALCESGFVLDETQPYDLRAAVAKASSFKHQLQWLATTSQATEQDVTSFLTAQQNDTKPTRLSKTERMSAAQIVEKFPSAVALMVDGTLSTSFLQLACGSRRITNLDHQKEAVQTAVKRSAGDSNGSDFALVALVNNPVCHTEVIENVATLNAFERASQAASRRLLKMDTQAPVMVTYENVTEDAALEWLVRRATSFSNKYGDYTPPKPFELCALARNSNLTVEQQNRVKSEMSNTWVCEVVGLEIFNVAAAALGLSPVEAFDVPKYAPFLKAKAIPLANINLEHAEQGGTVVASMLSSPFRLYAHSFVDLLDFTEDQWQLFLQLVEMMPDTPLLNVAQATEAM